MKTDKGFVILVKEGKHCPAIVCETCGAVIDDLNWAGVVWHREGEAEGSRLKVTVLCKKNDCLNKPPYKGLPWQELRNYLIWLAYNSGLNTEEKVREAWKSGEWMSSV